jgi:tetratricopeptide (TPR) repeat protein
MGKLVAIFVIVFLSILGVLAYFNNATVDLTIWKGVTYTIPVVALILASSAVGIFSMLVIYTIRDARRYIDSWQIQRQQKKELKIQESYARGLDAFFASRYREAEDLFTRVTQEDPSNFNALMRLGDIAFEKKEFSNAKDFYMRARELKPRNIEAMLSLERVAKVQKNWQDALKYLDSILEIDSENLTILYKKREIYEKIKRWEELLEVQHKILKCNLSPEEEQEENKKLLGYKYELGRDYLETGATDKAVKTLKAIIKIDKNFIPAYLALAEAYLKEGDNKEAGSLLLKGYEETSSLVILARLEDLYITEGEPGTIIDIYQRAIQKDQKDMRLQFFLAKLYYRLEMIDYALETASGIDTATFDCHELHTLLGNIYERRAQHEKAVHEFRIALGEDKPLLVPFCCSNCNYTTNDWSGRCPECNNWNTITFNIDEACKVKKRQSSS